MNQKGFTLIELVVVIVVLGILAAVAVPKFVDMKGEAADAALKGVAGGMGSAMALNYAAESVSAGKGTSITDCNQVGTIMDGGIPDGYSVDTNGLTSGTSADCTVNQTSTGNSASFTGIGV